jgi:hypothetical protein
VEGWNFNPELASHATNIKLAKNLPFDAIVSHTMYRDNPWRSEALRIGREQFEHHDPEKTRHQAPWQVVDSSFGLAD